MNDLKEKPEKVKPFIIDQYYKLLVAYGQKEDEERFQESIKLIEIELTKLRNLNKYALDKTYKELLNNFTTYRKVCPASYMTAFAKMNHK